MAWTRAALALVAAGAVVAVLVSGGSSTDPRTPAGLPRMPPPFLGVAVVGSGELTAAIDAYGDVVDLRAPGPAGWALIDNPADRQAAGSVAADTGVVPWVVLADRPATPLWRADRISQRYRPGTNVLVTRAWFGAAWVEVVYAARGGRLACRTRARDGARISMRSGEPAARARLRCNGEVAAGTIRAASRADRRWLTRARPLGDGAPVWARRMYERSLLVLRALTDHRTGSVAAGARDGWAYVWPRDAGTAALAFAAAGYRPQARRVAGFLLGLDLGAAARFHGDGTPVEGRGAQGDASGWAAVAARAAGLPPPHESLPWRDRPDYQEGDPGDYLGNAIATTPPVDGPKTRLYGGKSAHRRAVGGIRAAFGAGAGLLRRAGDPESGLDSAAAWAVRPFPLPALFRAARQTLLRLTAAQTRFGITPGQAWPGTDPWTAPTAWSAWSLAALADRRRQRPALAPANRESRRRAADPAKGESQRQSSARRDRRAALRLLGALRRAATPAGALPERVDNRTGIPRSTTPLVWSHAFAILALRQLWPSSSAADFRPTPLGQISAARASRRRASG